MRLWKREQHVNQLALQRNYILAVQRNYIAYRHTKTGHMDGCCQEIDRLAAMDNHMWTSGTVTPHVKVSCCALVDRLRHDLEDAEARLNRYWKKAERAKIPAFPIDKRCERCGGTFAVYDSEENSSLRCTVLRWKCSQCRAVKVSKTKDYAEPQDDAL
jgi:hypothetical protein